VTHILAKRLAVANLRYNSRMEIPLFPVCVVMRRVPIVNRWVSEKWELADVAPDAGTSEISCTALADNAWLWRGFTLDLHPSEAEGYYLNLSAPDPRVFVISFAMAAKTPRS